MEKKAEDAKFLDKLFNDNISDDSDVQKQYRDEQYDAMRGRLEEDDMVRDNFINNLELPKYDGEENPTTVKDDLLA